MNKDAEILNLAQQGLTYQEISDHMCTTYPNIRGFSLKSVKRSLKQANFKRKGVYSDTQVSAHVANASFVLGPETGRRFIKGYLEGTGVAGVSEKRIRRALKSLDPENHTRRATRSHRRLNPIPYRALYFGHRLHLDQNEKLVRFGCTLVAGIDGYSGFVVGIIVMPLKNNLTIYENLYKRSVEQYGLWDQLVVDHGKEFYLTLAVQEALSERRNNVTICPFRQVKSTVNNRIERVWPEVNQRILYPLKEGFESLDETGDLDLSDETDRFCCSQVAQIVVRAALQDFLVARNNRSVAGRGIPVDLMRNSHASQLPPGLLPSAEVAAAQYRANGGQMTNPSDFGNDPIGNIPNLVDLRSTAVGRFGFSPSEILSFARVGQFAMLQNFFNHYRNVTRDLLRQ